MIKTRINNEYKDIIKIFGGSTLQKEITKVWSREANKYVYESSVEYTGNLPITINADGTALIDYQIYGNTVQNGAPTPESPVDVVGCGVRTENLAPFIDAWGYGYVTDSGAIHNPTDDQERYSPRLAVEPGATYQIDYQTGSFPAVDKSDLYKQSWIGLGWYNDDGFITRALISNAARATFVAPVNAKYMILSFRSFGENYNCMIIKASIPPEHYIPYGYKLPILSNSAVTNIYLGEVETTRRIKKFVFDGTENWEIAAHPMPKSYQFIIPRNIYFPDAKSNIAVGDSFCTHFIGQKVSGGLAWGTYFNLYMPISDLPDNATADDFKAFLTTQYAAGTPVTVWYVLAEPETGIVNEPLMKLGDYADTLSMEQTAVQIPTIAGITVIDYDGATKPSQMYIKYRR
jgi:hypothetical protein